MVKRAGLKDTQSYEPHALRQMLKSEGANYADESKDSDLAFGAKTCSWKESQRRWSTQRRVDIVVLHAVCREQ